MSVQVLHGHCLDKLRELPDESVHCVVTSPPYWGLRDYQLPPVHWPEVRWKIGYADFEMVTPAWLGVFGLEPNPELYVAHSVLIFREMRRVLRKDGTLWLNLGDSYASSAVKYGGSQGGIPCKQNSNRGSRRPAKADVSNFKCKDLIGIPWRVALALQADGWYLRAENIWHKSNPMPESVLDRPTRAHEQVFLFSKSQRYFYDWFAVQEPCQSGPSDLKKMREKRDRINAKHFHTDPGVLAKASILTNVGRKRAVGNGASRRRRSVWQIASQPYRGAHFATFPEKLAEICIRAGSSQGGCCAHCGAPFKRIVVNGAPDLEHRLASGSDANGEYHGRNTKDYQQHRAQAASTVKARILAGMIHRHSRGFAHACLCVQSSRLNVEGSKFTPCLVLDPFGGSGTVGLVARRLGRSALLIEMAGHYLPLIHQRLDCAKPPTPHTSAAIPA